MEIFFWQICSGMKFRVSKLSKQNIISGLDLVCELDN